MYGTLVQQLPKGHCSPYPMNPRPFLYTLLVLALVSAVSGTLKPRTTIRAVEEQAVILKLKLDPSQMDTKEGKQRIHDLEDRMEASIKRSAAGEVDGDEYGDGYCTIYMYGPSADALFRAIEDALRNYPAHAGSYVLKRYGKPGAKQDRVPLRGH